MEEQVFKEITGHLEAAGVRYCVVGGVAVRSYIGAGRLTVDQDFAVAGERAGAQAMRELLGSIGYKTQVARQADLDGGPLFAIKRKNTPERVVIGRKSGPASIGVDILLESNVWVPNAVTRAQDNRLEVYGIAVPVIPLEDLLLAKFLAAEKRGQKKQDVMDIKELFSSKREIDLMYLGGEMRRHGITVPRLTEQDVPKGLLDVSREIKKKVQKGIER